MSTKTSTKTVRVGGRSIRITTTVRTSGNKVTIERKIR